MSIDTARTFCRCLSVKRPKYSPSVSALRSSPIHSTVPSPKSHTTVRYESCPLRHAFSSSPITSGISFPFRAKPRRTARCSIIHASSRLTRRSRRAPATPSSRSTSMAKHSNRMVNRPFGSAHDSRTCRTPCSVHEILGGRACSRVVYCIVSKCRHTRSSLWSYSGHGSPHSGHRHRSSPCSTHTCTCRCSSFSSTRSTRQGVLNPSNCRYSSVSRIDQVSSHHARGTSSSPTENPQEPQFSLCVLRSAFNLPNPRQQAAAILNLRKTFLQRRDRVLAPSRCITPGAWGQSPTAIRSAPIRRPECGGLPPLQSLGRGLNAERRTQNQN